MTLPHTHTHTRTHADTHIENIYLFCLSHCHCPLLPPPLPVLAKPKNSRVRWTCRKVFVFFFVFSESVFVFFRVLFLSIPLPPDWLPPSCGTPPLRGAYIAYENPPKGAQCTSACESCSTLFLALSLCLSLTHALSISALVCGTVCVCVCRVPSHSAYHCGLFVCLGLVSCLVPVKLYQGRRCRGIITHRTPGNRHMPNRNAYQLTTATTSTRKTPWKFMWKMKMKISRIDFRSRRMF